MSSALCRFLFGPALLRPKLFGWDREKGYLELQNKMGPMSRTADGSNINRLYVHLIWVLLTEYNRSSLTFKFLYLNIALHDFLFKSDVESHMSLWIFGV